MIPEVFNASGIFFRKIAMKSIIQSWIVISMLALANIQAQSYQDSVRVSEFLTIQRGDSKKWIERFQKDIDRYIYENRQQQGESYDALFLGSSSINLWPNLPQDMAPLKVLKRSYGGATIRDILYNYNVVARGYNIRCIVLYVENDFFSCKEGISEYETFDLFRVFARRVQTDYPNTPLFIISFKPSFAKASQLGQQKVINHLLETYAQNIPGIQFIDITKVMYDETGNLRKDIFLADNLHMNQKGYDLWTSIIKPVIMNKL